MSLDLFQTIPYENSNSRRRWCAFDRSDFSATPVKAVLTMLPSLQLIPMEIRTMRWVSHGF